MRQLLHALFGVAVGVTAAGLVSLLDISSTMMFGVGMLYGSLVQLSAGKLFPDRPAVPETSGFAGISGHEAIESPTLTNGAAR